MSLTHDEFVFTSSRWLSRPGLTQERRLQVWLSAASALTLHRPIHWIIDCALSHGLMPIKLKEVILQNYLFCGFPATIEGLIILQKALTDRGMTNEDFSDPRTPEAILEDGKTLCRKIYGKNFDKLTVHMQSLSADIYDWMIREGYGKVLSRSVLSPPERELCIVASLSSLRRERQLIAHLKGALRVGVSRDEIRESLEALRLLVTDETVKLALEIFVQLDFRKSD